MRRLTTTVIALLALASAALAQESITFKGHELGAARDKFLEAFPGASCKGAPKYGDTCAWFPSRSCSSLDREAACFKQFNYGGVLPNAMLATFYRERLVSVRVYYPTTGYRGLRDAMTARFGDPADTKQEILQNRMGAKFENERLMWLRGDAILSLRQRGTKVDEGIMMLSSKSFHEEMKSQDKTEAKARANEL